MSTSEIIILVTASIMLGITTGIMVAVVTMRHLLHTKDARIKILNEKIETLDKWSDTLFNEEDMYAAYVGGAMEYDYPDKKEFNKWLADTYKPIEKVQKPVDQVIADITVQAQHKEHMDTYWDAEKELIEEDKRTGPTC